jgi:Right handed beta helix region
MQHVKSIWTAIAVASSLFAISAPAHAQATRTWVSGVGNDSDPCSRTAPCKTFAGAISKTTVNGIINCIDSGAYGAVTIIKSITIDCHDVFASILNNQDAPTGIIINIAAGDPKDPWRTVRLRNIDIAGVGTASTGISVVSAAAVILEEVEITGFVKQGISDVRTEGGTMLTVKNSVIANNTGAVGILASAASTNNVVLDNVHSDKNAYGIAVGKGNNVVINRSVLYGNTTAGVEVDSSGQLTLDSSVVGNNLVGFSGAGSTSFGNSDISFNATAFSSPTTTYGNNRVFGNSATGTPPTGAGGSTPALGQQ